MCYTPSYSRDALIINTIGSLILFHGTDKPSVKAFAIFLAFVGLMQLYDYIFWTNPPPNPLNRVTTKAAMLTNHLQPLVLAGALAAYTGRVGPMTTAMLALYSLVALDYSIKAWHVIGETAPVTPNKGLYWEWNYLEGYREMYVLFLMSTLVTVMENIDGHERITFSAAITASFVFAWRKYGKDASTGRFWCYFAAFVPALLWLFL